MNAYYLMLLAVSLAAGTPPSEPAALTAGAETADNSYVEITDLSPVPAQAMQPKRVIHASPRVDPVVEVASAQFDIAPLGMTSPLLGTKTTSAPVGTATLMPPSNSTTMQPVEPASTRPFISPSAPVARTYLGPPTTIVQPAATTVYPAPQSSQTIVTGPARTVTLMPALPAPGMKYGHGIIGQPKVYVDGQPMRNFFRWLSP